MQVSAKVLIEGRVQGVFFRSEIRREAQVRGLTGWVRNVDIYVEALLEGDRDKIEEVIEFCREGPIGSKVKNVNVEWNDFSGNFQNFEIRY